MTKKFISFLGVGPEGEGYNVLKYSYAERSAAPQTQFVQRAELEMLGSETFDKIIILCTQESFKEYYHDLRNELVDDLKIDPDRIMYKKTTSRLNTSNQWELFSLVNQIIENGDQIVFDFTHGFRLLSIILSTALNFITKSKPNVVLEHVFYGQQENEIEGTIIDMKEFYIINEWADGVEQFINGADASKLLTLASEENTTTSFSGLKNQDFIHSMEQLTRVIKDINVNKISTTCSHALEIIQEQKSLATNEEKQLLNLIENKFINLSSWEPLSGLYDISYLETQLKFAQILVKHNLFMQAFTVMRELIVSTGMLGCTGKYKNKKIDSSDGRKYRSRFGEIFINLCQYPRKEWEYFDEKKKKNIEGSKMNDFKTILPFYERLEEKGIAKILQSFVSEMADYRNGFDHAWTGKSKKQSAEYMDAPDKADAFLKNIQQVLAKLKQHEIS